MNMNLKDTILGAIVAILIGTPVLLAMPGRAAGPAHQGSDGEAATTATQRTGLEERIGNERATRPDLAGRPILTQRQRWDATQPPLEQLERMTTEQLADELTTTPLSAMILSSRPPIDGGLGAFSTAHRGVAILLARPDVGPAVLKRYEALTVDVMLGRKPRALSFLALQALLMSKEISARFSPDARREVIRAIVDSADAREAYYAAQPGPPDQAVLGSSAAWVAFGKPDIYSAGWALEKYLGRAGDERYVEWKAKQTPPERVGDPDAMLKEAEAVIELGRLHGVDVKAVERGGLQTWMSYVADANERGNPVDFGGKIVERLWAPEIRDLHPLLVYANGVNVVVVLAARANEEQGIFINPPIASSLGPHMDEFALRPLGAPSARGVMAYTRRGTPQSPWGAHAQAFSRLQGAAWQTQTLHVWAVRRGQVEPAGDVPEQLWTRGIRMLRPLRVYFHSANVAVVLKQAGNVEEGVYIYVPISSFIPFTNGDGFEWTKTSDNVWTYKRTPNAPGA